MTGAPASGACPSLRSRSPRVRPETGAWGILDGHDGVVWGVFLVRLGEIIRLAVKRGQHVLWGLQAAEQGLALRRQGVSGGDEGRAGLALVGGQSRKSAPWRATGSSSSCQHWVGWP
jgi:hypothetical protein